MIDLSLPAAGLNQATSSLARAADAFARNDPQHPLVIASCPSEIAALPAPILDLLLELVEARQDYDGYIHSLATRADTFEVVSK